MDPEQETEETKQVSNKDVPEKSDGAKQSEKEDNKALFDQPLVLEGKRKRKSTELFSFSEGRKALEYAGGEGCRFGDIPFIEHNISRLKSDQLKSLFRLCFDRTGAKAEIKRSLRDFSGFSDKDLVEKKRVSLERMLVPALKTLCELLGLETSGKKEDIITRILEFLTKPVDLGKVPKKRRRSSAGSGRARKKSKPSESDEEEKGDDLEDEVMDESQENDDGVMDTSQTSANGNAEDTTEPEPTKGDKSRQNEDTEPNKEDQQKENQTEQASTETESPEKKAPLPDKPSEVQLQQEPVAATGDKEE